jgi:hypothetical protein
MITINKSHVKNVKNHLPNSLLGQQFYISVPLKEISSEVLKKIGFDNAEIGQEIVPAPNFKRVTFFNAEGGYIKRRDLPKETLYREQEWTWTDWSGDTHSKTVFVPYLRYVREYIPAPGETMSIVKNSNGESLIASKQVVYQEDNEKQIKLIINLFLEIFGYCEVRNARLDTLVPIQIIKLNWDILPSGTTCWQTLQQQITPILKRKMRQGTHSIVLTRLEKLNKLNPNFVAVGKGGFHGYVIFAFENKSRFVLESIYTGNAVYVFDDNWQKLSQLSKAQIINGELQIARIIHQEGYWNQVLTQVA